MYSFRLFGIYELDDCVTVYHQYSEGIHLYKNIKRKLYRTNAAIWYNKTCLADLKKINKQNSCCILLVVYIIVFFLSFLYKPTIRP